MNNEFYQANVTRRPCIGYRQNLLLVLYAKITLHSLTALKMSSKCSFIPYKLRFFIHFRLVMKHNPDFCIRLFGFAVYRENLVPSKNTTCDKANPTSNGAGCNVNTANPMMNRANMKAKRCIAPLYSIPTSRPGMVFAASVAR
uniref:Uncharacterized protein n=1 Tax=Candidatus Kentrum sp. DK TaxID=2126562 RepID=A0A450S566_9GAMM|nr:MAG: hypothetical protein BECKDK2373C_GA0170839_100231 [Candidatus Kentron sp. DK]VFJ47040.1 MAG: hypothetical protein BECKDK2373B_GA0170837_101524 [Candidatus Kentron sp. DK]